MDEFKNEMIEGRNAVLEALRAGRALDKDVYKRQGELLPGEVAVVLADRVRRAESVRCV